MEFLKDLQKYRREKRNKKFDITDIEVFLNSIQLETIKHIASSNLAPPPEGNDKFAVYSTYCGPTRKRTFKGKPLKSNVKHYFISNNPEILASVTKFGWIPFYLDIPIYDNVVFLRIKLRLPKLFPICFSS